MTQEKPMPLLNDEDLIPSSYVMGDWDYASMYATGRHVRTIYEQARQSDLAKIEALTKLAQELVDRLAFEFKATELRCSKLPCLQCERTRDAIKSTEALGITPTPEP